MNGSIEASSRLFDLLFATHPHIIALSRKIVYLKPATMGELELELGALHSKRSEHIPTQLNRGEQDRGL